jgi:hypothetical protein
MHRLSLQFLKISLQIANCREEPRGDRFASDCILSHAVRSPPDRIQDSRTMCELLHTGSGRFTSIVAGSLSDR